MEQLKNWHLGSSLEVSSTTDIMGLAHRRFILRRALLSRVRKNGANAVQCSFIRITFRFISISESF